MGPKVGNDRQGLVEAKMGVRASPQVSKLTQAAREKKSKFHKK
jgi:hypothetical protein